MRRRKQRTKVGPPRPSGARLGTPQALDTLCDRIANHAFAPELPPTLWHYTTREGLEGILSTRKLWATDYRAQKTDELEFRHADDAILQLAESLGSDQTLSTWHRARINVWIGRLRNDPWRDAADRLFITSFCDAGDSPHMWNTFGNGGTGFAFELALLRESFGNPNYGLLITQVDYDEASVIRRLRDIVLKILDTSRAYRVKDRREADRITERQLWWVGTKAAVQCKGATFAADHEWRRVSTPRSPRLIVSGAGPRRLEIPLRNGGRIPRILTIRIGESAPVDAEAHVTEFLSKHGYVGNAAPRIERAPGPLCRRF